MFSVSHDSAEFTGFVENYTELKKCPSETKDGELQVGVFYSSTPGTSPADSKKAQGSLNEDGTFTVSVTGLAPNTIYYYGLVLVHTPIKYINWGDVQEFTTLSAPAVNNLLK